ncbi:MAG: hypothetical protein ACTHLW_19570 [Verrucomicrobiota bacterium]
MIDTVCYSQSHTLKGGKLSKQWKKTPLHQTFASKFSIRSNVYLHSDSGLRFQYFGKGKANIQVSLPRLLFGKNAKLISNQEELDAAFRHVDDLIEEIALPPFTSEREFSRIDLAWQVKGNIKDFIFAHRALTHPEIHKKPWIWQDETILWAGKEMSICFYDKTMQTEEEPGAFVRIEIRLKNDKLKKEFGKSLKNLNFLKSYQIFRRKLIQFAPNPIPQISKQPTKNEIFILAENYKWMVGPHESAFEFLTKNYSEPRRKQKLKLVKATRLKAHRIDWGKELPLGKPNRLIKQDHADFSIKPFYFRFKRITDSIIKGLEKAAD